MFICRIKKFNFLNTTLFVVSTNKTFRCVEIYTYSSHDTYCYNYAFILETKSRILELFFISDNSSCTQFCEITQYFDLIYCLSNNILNLKYKKKIGFKYNLIIKIKYLNISIDYLDLIEINIYHFQLIFIFHLP